MPLLASSVDYASSVTTKIFGGCGLSALRKRIMLAVWRERQTWTVGIWQCLPQRNACSAPLAAFDFDPKPLLGCLANNILVSLAPTVTSLRLNNRLPIVQHLPRCGY